MILSLDAAERLSYIELDVSLIERKGILTKEKQGDGTATFYFMS